MRERTRTEHERPSPFVEFILAAGNRRFPWRRGGISHLGIGAGLRWGGLTLSL